MGAVLRHGPFSLRPRFVGPDALKHAGEALWCEQKWEFITGYKGIILCDISGN